VVILEDPDRRERFTVPADERLRAAARGDVQRLGQMSMELESQLRPREIQARIRAGASVEQVAAAAGVPHQRIERFAYPVLLERSRIADMARQAHPVRSDGPDVRNLDEVVAHTFRLRGQDYEEAAWDAWRGEDHKWVVALSWKVGRSDITARWGYHPGSHGGTVSPLDEHATDLIDGQLSRPPRRVGPVIDFSKPEAGATSVEGELADELDGRPAAPGPSGQDDSTPVAAEHSPAEEPSLQAEKTRATGTERPSASRGSAAGRRATKTTTGRGAATSARPSAEAAKSDGQPGAAEGAEPSTGGSAAKRGRKAKPVMPSWEDVLLGVKSQRS
jgi:hypothetical protein